jgi:hypothetical protein
MARTFAGNGAKVFVRDINAAGWAGLAAGRTVRVSIFAVSGLNVVAWRKDTMAATPEPPEPNTIGSTAELQRSATPNERRRSNWGFAITMLAAVVGIAVLAWGLT